MPSGQEIKHGLLITTTNTMTRVGEKERKKERKRKEGGEEGEMRKEKKNPPGDFYSLHVFFSHLQPHKGGGGVREMRSLGYGGKPSK